MSNTHYDRFKMHSRTLVLVVYHVHGVTAVGELALYQNNLEYCFVMGTVSAGSPSRKLVQVSGFRGELLAPLPAVVFMSFSLQLI